MDNYNNYYKAISSLRRHLAETGLDAAIVDYLAINAETRESAEDGHEG